MGRNAIAHEVSDHDSPDRYGPGAYHFIHHFDSDVRAGIVHGCPCGCGISTMLFFKGQNRDHPGEHEWSVSGEWPNVTLTPSIGIGKQESGPNGFHWHGFLENGVFVER